MAAPSRFSSPPAASGLSASSLRGEAVAYLASGYRRMLSGGYVGALWGGMDYAPRLFNHGIGASARLDAYRAGLLPADKVREVEALLGEGRLAFVGDGINDAPVLARADIGIAMGALGSDAAIEAADVVLMDDKPSKVALAVRIARRTLRIARENIWLAIGIKLLVLLLAAFGLATLWMAVFADVGVTVLAVLNAMRALRAAQ